VVLALGVVLVVLAADLAEPAQVLAAATRDLGLAAMGAALLLPPRSSGHRRPSAIPPPTMDTVGAGTRR
jgi:hypothetical protein